MTPNLAVVSCPFRGRMREKGGWNPSYPALGKASIPWLGNRWRGPEKIDENEVLVDLPHVKGARKVGQPHPPPSIRKRKPRNKKKSRGMETVK